MQFTSNSDFPAGNLHTLQWAQIAQHPIQFDDANFESCASITTRVIIQSDGMLNNTGVTTSNAQHVKVGAENYIVKTAKGVLVRTSSIINGQSSSQGSNNNVNGGGEWSDSSDDMEDNVDTLPTAQTSNSATAQMNNGTSSSTSQHQHSLPLNTNIERAYWLRQTLRAAIYGQVRYGIVLQRLNPPLQVILPNTNESVSIEWEETNASVAIKEMSWEHIRTQRDRLAEDPIKEVAAMQYLSKWLSNEQQKQQTLQLMQQLSVAQAATAAGVNINMNGQFAGMNNNTLDNINIPIMDNAGSNGSNQWIGQQQQQNGMPTTSISQSSTLQNAIHQTPQNMLESHIMMPMDLLSDNRNLYSIMPYCTGGELFEVLERKSRFTEPEARHWMKQILKGLSCLKKAGVTHRDLSLENLLVHEDNVLVIDLGMCLRIPSFVNQNNSTQRYLILPQGVCGKWHYMSPEVLKNQLPFDGPAVDLWAVGVILFLMLTGFPPWERPCQTDERFRYMSNGYLVQMLTEWNVGLSADAMDLLQRMFWLEPTDRLSLEQVCAHPWMNQ